MTTRTTNWLRGERGSVPLALLVVIIMAGLTSVVMSRAVAEQRSTRFDNEYTTAIHAAEAGLEEAAFAINNHLAVTGYAEGTGAINGYDYTWWAQQQPDESWVVGSRGTGPDGVTRTVGVDLTDRPIFDLSLATHMGINFAGSNRADSYNSATQRRCSPPSSVGCFGIIASNGDINLGSASSTNNYADRVRVHDWANPDNTGDGRCQPATSSFCQPPHRQNIDEPLDIHAHVPLVEDMLDACGGVFAPWRASDHGGVLRRSTIPMVTGFDGHDDIDEFGCVSELTFDEDTTVPDDLVLVVRDRTKIDGRVKVNCAACGSTFPASPNMPVARRLQILTLAADTGASGSNVLAAVQIRQHAKLAAGVYAPYASCGNQQSNAQVEIYGSLICDSVLNQGGWSFHYDEALVDSIRTGEYFVDRWREE